MDLMHLADDLAAVEESDVSFLHFDVVDGVFNTCFILGAPTLEALRKCTDLPIEAHLAVMKPEFYFSQYVDAGADYIAFHAETQNAEETLRLCDRVRSLGASAILALRAETNLDDSYIPVLRSVEWVLKLLVQPGYSGQTLGEESLASLRHIAGLLREHAPNAGLQADGNVNLDTIPDIVGAGADILTGGTSGLFKGKDVKGNARRMLERARENISSSSSS
jgi:ribulose-phosphate 3-epimerase